MHFFFFFLSEYLSHLLFLQLFVLSAHGGELLGGGANGGGVSHRPQVFLHFFSFLSEYFLHFLFLHHFALYTCALRVRREISPVQGDLDPNLRAGVRVVTRAKSRVDTTCQVIRRNLC